MAIIIFKSYIYIYSIYVCIECIKVCVKIVFYYVYIIYTLYFCGTLTANMYIYVSMIYLIYLFQCVCIVRIIRFIVCIMYGKCYVLRYILKVLCIILSLV